MRRRASCRPRVLEKTEQANIVELARSVGCDVYVLGTVRRGSLCQNCGAHVAGHRGTQQTPGIPDLEIWLPAHGIQRVLHDTFGNTRELVKWETKSETGRLSDEQKTYRDMCAAGGVTWGCGTFADFEQFLVTRGLVIAQWIPHYRQPKAKP